jgi:hypothetical protein
VFAVHPVTDLRALAKKLHKEAEKNDHKSREATQSTATFARAKEGFELLGKHMFHPFVQVLSFAFLISTSFLFEYKHAL